MARAALSYSRAASSAVSKVPSHRRTFLVVSRISAAYFPQGLNLTPRYLKVQQCNVIGVYKQSLIMIFVSPQYLCKRLQPCWLDKLWVSDLHFQQQLHARAPNMPFHTLSRQTIQQTAVYAIRLLMTNFKGFPCKSKSRGELQSCNSVDTALLSRYVRAIPDNDASLFLSTGWCVRTFFFLYSLCWACCTAAGRLALASLFPPAFFGRHSRCRLQRCW